MSQYLNLSPKNSEHTFGIEISRLDVVDLHFLQTSKIITTEQIQALILPKIVKDDGKPDFKGINEWDKVKISTLKLSDRYFKYLKDTPLAKFDGSIVFYCEVGAECIGIRYILWPLMSEVFFLVMPDMVVLEDDKRRTYTQKIELGVRSDIYGRGDEHALQMLSFSRVFQTGPRSLFKRRISYVYVLRDEVEEKLFLQDDCEPHSPLIIQTRQEEPLWLIRHQNGVEWSYLSEAFLKKISQ